MPVEWQKYTADRRSRISSKSRAFAKGLRAQPSSGCWPGSSSGRWRGRHKTERAMAEELKTSRLQLDRLLDPQNTSVSLDTMSRVAKVLGKRLVLRIEERKPRRARTSKAARTGARRRAEVAGRLIEPTTSA